MLPIGMLSPGFVSNLPLKRYICTILPQLVRAVASMRAGGDLAAFEDISKAQDLRLC